MPGATVPMDVFKWVVTGLLAVLVAGVGWLLGDIRADLRDMRRDVAAIRIDAAATTARLEGLVEDGRRRSPR